MEETNYEELKLKDENDEGKSVLIKNSADRPNAFNSYRESKQTAADVKAMFDRPFLYVKNKFNALIDVMKGRDKAIEDKLAAQDTKLAAFEKSTDDKLVAQDTKLAAQDEEIKRIAEKADSINNYDLTDADKEQIAGIIVESLNGNDIAYTGEEVSEDG